MGSLSEMTQIDKLISDMYVSEFFSVCTHGCKDRYFNAKSKTSIIFKLTDLNNCSIIQFVIFLFLAQRNL